MKLWYQIDIAEAGWQYRHAEVQIFQTEGDIEDVYNPDPVLIWQGQSDTDCTTRGKAFIPKDARHNCIQEGQTWCSWYGNNMTSKCRYFHETYFAEAARLLKRLDKAADEWAAENPEERDGDTLKRMVCALRRLKAQPVRWENFKYVRME